LIDSHFWSRAVSSLRGGPDPQVEQVAIADVWAPLAERRNLVEEYPEAVGMVVHMGDVTYRISNMDPSELYCLAVIARIRQPRTIFEFGTYDGATTRWLAQVAPHAEIFTIDLPLELRGEWESATLVDRSSGGDGLGARFRDTAAASRITQLLGDSRTYDFTEYFGSMDLIVVDADHAYESARSDTESALNMLSTRGVVIWDDYVWPGVVQAVDEAAEHHGFRAINLAPSELAVYDRAAQDLSRNP
jgi:predicted O-methyltransferase YrrM